MFKEGDWVMTKSKKYGYVGFIDDDPNMTGNCYLYFFNPNEARSYNPKGLTLVDKPIADILNATYHDIIEREIKC